MRLDGHSSSIQSAVFSHDDKKVFTIGIDQNLIIWEVNMEEQTKRELSRLRTKHCVDMSLKANTIVSINKSQAYCYFFSQPDQPSKANATGSNEESW